MPRKPKPKNDIPAGERAKLYLEMQKEKFSDGEGNKINESIEDVKKPTAPKKVIEKPKPQYALLKADLSLRQEKTPVLHGMCNGPLSYSANISRLFRDMKTPYVRNCAWDGEGSRYAFDVSRVFPDENADDSDPQSYDFSLTDKYMKGIYDANAKCIYSFSDSDRKRSFCMKDPDKWARVCVRIIKHYNDYFANGFAYGISVFEISPFCVFDDECDKNTLFSVYAKTAMAIKLIDSDYKVGGMSFNMYCDRGREFLRFCSQKKIPLDFVSFHAFSDSIFEVCEACEKYTANIHNFGLDGTKIMISAWNYLKISSGNVGKKTIVENASGEYTKEQKDLFLKEKSIEGAAYCMSLLTSLANYPLVEYACYYDAQPQISKFCGICDIYGDKQKPYYAFCAYGKTAENYADIYSESLQDESMQHSGVWVHSGVSRANDKDEINVIISCFDGAKMVDLRLENIPDGMYTADIYMSDGVKDMEFCDSVPITGDRKRILLNVSSFGYAIVRIY